MRTSINKKSDFDFIVLDNEGNAIDMPTSDFTLDLWTWGSKCRFRASSIGGVLKGCKSEGGKLRVYVDNPGFVPGKLVGEWITYAASEDYADGSQRTCRYISDFGIDMVDGDSQTNEQQVLAMMQYIQGASAYEIACEYGYQGTEEEWLNSLSLESVNAANECRELMAQLSAAEDVRNANEQTRIANEQARVESEGSRSYEEDRRADAERTRIHNESVRHNREEIRQDAENYRITHENSRESHETIRQNSETARVAAEESRVAAEESRKANEQARATAEASRIAAESSRDRTHDRLKAAMREYADAESLREEAEAERREAEQYRIEYEQSRQSSEATRATAESSRATAEQQRVTAETARSNAESSRVTSEAARQTAETARQEAEQGRVTAEQQRADAEAARAEEFATFEGKIDGLDSVVEKTVVSTKSIKNGGAGNSSNGYKVRTLALDIRGVDKIVLTTDRPIPYGSIYKFEYCLALEEAAIGKFFSSNDNPNGYTTINMIGINQGDIVECSGYAAIVIGVFEIPKNGKEGDVVLRASNYGDYRIGYTKATANSELPIIYNKLSEIEAILNDNSIPKAVKRNENKMIALGAACRQRKSNNQSKDFQIIEITDSHSDAQSLSNCVDIANGFTTIDCLVHCGDAVGDYVTPQTSATAIVNSLKNSTKPWFFVIGNHEAGTYNVVGYVPSQNKLYNEFVKPIVECGHLSDGEFQVGKCYYYHDFSNYGIRLICVNEYDGDLALDNEYWQAVAYNSSANSFAWDKQYNVGDIIKMPYYTDYCFKCLKPAKSGASIYQRTGQEPKYKAVPGCRMISQQQAEWFVNTLLATPENYGVVIAMHAPFSINAIVDTTKKFSQTIDVASGTDAPNRMDDDFFAGIINAFINGLVYDKDIRFNDDADYLNTLTNSEGINYAYHLNVDFSKKSNGAKFLSYIGGHCHRDYVWKHPTYSKQWQVTPLCATVAPHQSPTSDIRRYGKDCLAYDSLTTISFNVNQRKISLVKIGCDVTETMEDRNYEIIELI